MNEVGVIDRFLAVFTQYIDSGFGLLSGEVAFLATTLIVIDVTLAATARAARDLDAAEIARAKAQLKVSLLSALETPGGRIERNARQILAWGRVIPAGEVIDKVDAVTVEDVRAAAAAMLQRLTGG